MAGRAHSGWMLQGLESHDKAVTLQPRTTGSETNDVAKVGNTWAWRRDCQLEMLRTQPPNPAKYPAELGPGTPLSSNLKSPTAKPNCATATQPLALYLILMARLGWNQTDHTNCQLPRDTCHHLQNAK